ATDNCTANPGIVCSPASGSTFAYGMTTVTCTATDGAGNTNACTFVVTVVDTTAPSITCVANKTAECGSAWTFDRPTALDNCDGTNVTISATPSTNALCGSTFSATRTWTATDTHGNISTPCSQTVTVVDTT